MELIAACLFAIAVLHTFMAKVFERLSRRFPSHAGFFHLLGEVEVVFGFWAIVLVFVMAFVDGKGKALAYAESRQYTEPLFVFVVMVIAASRPILQAIMATINRIAMLLPVRTSLATAWLSLAAVPLFGSIVTEPAAMTIAALMLAPQIFRSEVPERLKYFALVCERFDWRNTNFICGTTGADGRNHLELGFGLHAGHVWLESGHCCFCECNARSVPVASSSS
jgi:hypothetical protein